MVKEGFVGEVALYGRQGWYDSTFRARSLNVEIVSRFSFPPKSEDTTVSSSESRSFSDCKKFLLRCAYHARVTP